MASVIYVGGKCGHCGGSVDGSSEKCPFCGTVLSLKHDWERCPCVLCQAKRQVEIERMEDQADIETAADGIGLIGLMQANRRRDEAERAKLGLPRRERTGGNVIVINGELPKTQTVHYTGCICGAVTKETEKFCFSCGRPLSVPGQKVVLTIKVCSRCAAQNDQNAKYCHRCGLEF